MLKIVIIDQILKKFNNFYIVHDHTISQSSQTKSEGKEALNFYHVIRFICKDD